MAVELPRQRLRGELSVEEALLRRRSHREYRREPLTLGEVSQILWRFQGVTHPYGFRTAPSAGALYPLEVKRGNYAEPIYRTALSQEGDGYRPWDRSHRSLLRR